MSGGGQGAGGQGSGGLGSGSQLSTLLGCGCAGLITLFMVGVVLTTFATYRASQRLQEMADDPRAAAAAVREVAPYDDLPPGYAPRGTLSVPWMMDVAFLGGPGAPGDDDDFAHGFVVVRVRDWFDRGGRTRDWLTSGEGDDAPIEQQQLSFRPDEVIGRGELTTDGARVTWSARRGEVEIDLAQDGDADERDAGEAADGRVAETAGGVDAEMRLDARDAVLALLAIDCGDDGWERLGMWWQPDPAPGTPAAQIDWTGTPADPQAISDFLGHFRLCA